MPQYRNITTSFESQFDVLTVPEYKPPTVPSDPFQTVPQFINEAEAVVSVYIPIYSCSHFWLSYSIDPPHPEKALYYFKLYINGNEIVSWGCCEKDEFKGKTMFGLFSPGQSSLHHSVFERRVFCFGRDDKDGDSLPSNSLENMMEVRAYRARHRMRIRPEAPDLYSTTGKSNSKPLQDSFEDGINLVNGGLLPTKSPRRYYKYELFEPLDRPYATFRYYVRNYAQLEKLGVITRSASTDNSSTQSDPPTNQPLTQKASTQTLDSFSTALSSSESSTTPSTETMMHHANADISHSLPATRNTTPSTMTETESSIDSSTEQDLSSPLRAPRPFTLPRPATPPPPPTSTLTQLPPMIPPTNKTLNTLASKESFASLIRGRLHSPEPSAYQPQETEPRPPMPSRSRSNSLSNLNPLLKNAKLRHKRSVESSPSRELHPSEKIERKPSPHPAPTKATSRNENHSPKLTTSTTLPSFTSFALKPFAPADEGVNDEIHNFQTIFRNPIEKGYLWRKDKGKEPDRRRDSVGSGSGGSGSHDIGGGAIGSGGEKGGKLKKKERKKKNLWERL